MFLQVKRGFYDSVICFLCFYSWGLDDMGLNLTKHNKASHTVLHLRPLTTNHLGQRPQTRPQKLRSTLTRKRLLYVLSMITGLTILFGTNFCAEDLSSQDKSWHDSLDVKGRGLYYFEGVVPEPDANL